MAEILDGIVVGGTEYDVGNGAKDDSSQANLNIGDENGNVLAEFKDGHIKTKNFDSRTGGTVTAFVPADTSNEYKNIQYYGQVGSAIKTANHDGMCCIYLPANQEGYKVKLTTSSSLLYSSMCQIVNSNRIVTKLLAENPGTGVTLEIQIDFQEGDAGVYVNYSEGTLYTLGQMSLQDYLTAISDGDTGLFEFNKNKHLTLCSYVNKYTKNRTPYPCGYLYHKLKNDDGSLYFGTTLDNIKKLGNVKGVSPSACMVGLSPSGSVILTKRSERGSMFVYKDGETTELFADAELKPMGWLYNSGCDFFFDENGNEICEFAEYSGYNLTGTRYVWRGKAPYTSEDDWERVFEMKCIYQAVADTVTHFHMVKLDPWSNAIYLTAGDMPKQLRWWVSTDYGKTFSLLTDNATNGWEEHIGRVINFCFTKDWIYWANDHGTNHCLNKIARGDDGLIDPTTRVKICDLRFAQACNSTCLVDQPRGLFLFERIDTGGEYTQYYNTGFDSYFYDLENEELKVLSHINFNTSAGWGGNRGKCYTEYTTGEMPYPIIGFSIDTTCPFNELVIDDNSKIGSIQYHLDGSMKFIELKK